MFTSWKCRSFKPREGIKSGLLSFLTSFTVWMYIAQAVFCYNYSCKNPFTGWYCKYRGLKGSILIERTHEY